MPLSASTVIVPIDFSPASTGAIKAALEVAKDPSQIHLIHVMLPLETMSPGVLLGDLTDATRTASVKKALTTFANEHGASAAQLAVCIGTPGLEIADYAQLQQADLIIVPSHGYHGVKRLFLGSVAERIIRHAPCQVLVLRRPDAE